MLPAKSGSLAAKKTLHPARFEVALCVVGKAETQGVKPPS